MWDNYSRFMAKKIVLAVSGGVDSVVMLDLVMRHRSVDEESQNVFSATRSARNRIPAGHSGQVFTVAEKSFADSIRQSEITVAHFNHGIREDSGEDEEFVRALARRYGVEFRSAKGELGSGVNEEVARRARYGFLWGVAEECGGEIWTAHHVDDLVETVAINLIRGTGWRGLAVLDSEGIVRPMLGWTKREIIEYAVENRLEWREDSTNASDVYLRNRVRRVLSGADVLEEVLGLWGRQLELKREIEGIIEELGDLQRREFYREVDDLVGMEVLRGVLRREGVRVTRLQLRDCLEAVRSYKNGKRFNLPGGRMVRMGREEFEVEGCVK